VRYSAVNDFGTVINPLLVAGQLHGGVVQGIGQALMEQVVYGATDGQLITATFMDYALPRAADGPAFVFETNNIPCKTNPMGVKGAGEAGAIGASAAVINAITDAIGKNTLEMPATPDRVWRTIHAA
jgi:carbon-monoxide dehydrogenase large subunit